MNKEQYQKIEADLTHRIGLIENDLKSMEYQIEQFIKKTREAMKRKQILINERAAATRAIEFFGTLEGDRAEPTNQPEFVEADFEIDDQPKTDGLIESHVKGNPEKTKDDFPDWSDAELKAEELNPDADEPTTAGITNHKTKHGYFKTNGDGSDASRQ